LRKIVSVRFKSIYSLNILTKLKLKKSTEIKKLKEFKMLLPAMNRTSQNFEKVRIRKGYYPAMLASVKIYKDRDGNVLEKETKKKGTFGRQMIFDFVVYKGDPETGEPISAFTTVKDGETYPVKLSTFVYYEYRYKDPKTGEDKLDTAVTPKSGITQILNCLGWKFSEDGVDPEDFIGNWVEINVDDYIKKTEGQPDVTYSSIAGVNYYIGPTPKINEKPKKETNEVVEKTIKHPDVKSSDEISGQLAKIEALFKDGHISEEGYKQAKEQLEAAKREEK
jgi:hypothetical protein